MFTYIIRNITDLDGYNRMFEKLMQEIHIMIEHLGQPIVKILIVQSVHNKEKTFLCSYVAHL